MSRVCAVTGRRTRVGNQVKRRGLAKKDGGVGRRVTGRSKRKFKPNIQTVRVLDPKPPANRIEEILANMRKAFPALGEVRVAEAWAGMIDVTPDAIPVISGVDAIPGFFLSTGYSGHGFGIGPGAGRVTAELVTGAPTAVDLSPFRFSRFADGSAIGYGGAA